MDSIIGIAFAVFVVVFIVFDVIAVRLGVDSRPGIDDDRNWSI